MQDMAFNPLAAVYQSSQVADGSFDLDAEGILHRVSRAHLVGDGTYPADASGDVGRFTVASPAKKGFEEAGRLKYLKAHLRGLSALEADIQGAFTFYPRQVVYLHRVTFHGFHSLFGRLRNRH
jgi:hypothetical protein